MKKAFTTTELVVAIALLAIAISICGGVFGMAIKSHRQAVAIAEITRNFRAITDQINRDFAGLVKDGFLAIRNEEIDIDISEESEQAGQSQIPVRIDNLFYFSTGDFQSLLDTDNKSNISLIYLGYPKTVMDSNDQYCSEWNLVRNNILMLPDETSTGEDYVDYSLADYINNPIMFDLDDNLKTGPEPDFSDPLDMWQYFSSGIGNYKIQWSDATIDGNDVIEWYDMNNDAGKSFETLGPPYLAEWTPNNTSEWPEALKFTMTLYDSKGVLPQGKTFTHIVYIGE